MPALSSDIKRTQLTIENLSHNLVNGDCVNELIAQKILETKQDLEQKAKNPFKEIIDARPGESFSVHIKPLTFIQQVIAVTCLPELLDDPALPDDVKARAKHFLFNYQVSSADAGGLKSVRDHVAELLQKRDNCPADCEDIIVVPGAATAVKVVAKIVKFYGNGLPVGVMTSKPTFPAIMKPLLDLGVQKVEYLLKDDRGRSVDVNSLEEAFAEGQTHCDIRAVLVVNPGYLTGHVLSRNNIEEVVKFAARNNLLIIACEVYQNFVFDDVEFFSFKKVVCEMGDPFSKVKVISIMLYPGEFTRDLGLSNGFVEMFNIEPQIKNAVRESISSCDSAPLFSQIVLDCLVKPPEPNEPSFPLFKEETETLFTWSEVSAKLLYNGLNRVPGLSCQPILAGFSAFVKVNLPEKSISEAKLKNVSTSLFYVLEMIKVCGIVTWPLEELDENHTVCHFAITSLLPEQKLKTVLHRIQECHVKFVDLYK